MSEDSPVTFHRSDDPEFLQASQQARETFRYLWNQIALDFNRIIPALELACIKVPFSDDFSNPDAAVEHMWVDRVDFDGTEICGILANSPNWLKSLAAGDEVRFPLEQLSDWLCVLQGKVHGAYTIQLMRSRLNDEQRQTYDRDWQLDFPEPETVLLPERNRVAEGHIADKLAEQIETDPSTVELTFDGGKTLLHLEVLNGRNRSVRVLLEGGANASARCDRGWTPLDYARSLEWLEAIELLASA